MVTKYLRDIFISCCFASAFFLASSVFAGNGGHNSEHKVPRNRQRLSAIPRAQIDWTREVFLNRLFNAISQKDENYVREALQMLAAPDPLYLPYDFYTALKDINTRKQAIKMICNSRFGMYYTIRNSYCHMINCMPEKDRLEMFEFINKERDFSQLSGQDAEDPNEDEFYCPNEVTPRSLPANWN